VNAGSVATPTLAALRASRVAQQAMVRWLRALVPLILLVVLGAALRAHPAPGLHGRHALVTAAMAVFAVTGLGLVLTVTRGTAIRAAFVAAVLAASAALIWLQPAGAAIAGLFVGLSQLALLLRRRRLVSLIVLGLVLLALVVAAASHGSVTTAVLDAITLGAFYGVMMLSMRLGEANELAERLLAELERSRAAEARAAGLAERQRLAREMHDVLAHSLSGLMLQLEGARMLAVENPTDPRLPEAVNRAHQLGRTGLTEARRAIGMLRDEELPGPELLPTLAAQFQEDHNIDCRYRTAGEPRPLDPQARLAVYRVAQEALTNILRHAEATRVDLCLDYGPATTRLTVENTSRGTPSQPSDGGGYGLTGMRERAELLGGTLSAGPTPHGFRVELDLPT
jgi:signal transduction histidine kinase